MLEFEKGDPVTGPDGKIGTVETASSKAAWITLQGDNRIHDDAQYRHAPGSPKATTEAEAGARADRIFSQAQRDAARHSRPPAAPQSAQSRQAQIEAQPIYAMER
jgi:hypothetical protein